MKKAIAVIAAHADDIEYCAGATLAKYIADGYRALYGVLSRCNSGWTVTEEGGFYSPSQDIVPLRRAEAEAAAKTFGAELYYGDLLENCYTTRSGVRIVPSYGGPEGVDGNKVESVPSDDLPDGTLFSSAAGAGEPWDGHPVVGEITELLVRWEPELIIGQAFGNLNPDHFHAAQIVAIAWQLASKRVSIGPYWLPVMHREQHEYHFPPQKPDRFVDVGGYEEICLKAAACHVSQGCHLPDTQVKLAARWRGWKKQSGFDSTEAFAQIYPEPAP